MSVNSARPIPRSKAQGEFLTDAIEAIKAVGPLIDVLSRSAQFVVFIFPGTIV